MSTWLITGCSTGLGRSIAEAALETGHSVVATARNVDTLGDLAESHPRTCLTETLDVTDADRIEEVVAAARDRFDAVDVLVNNAGYGYRSAVEEAPTADVQRLFATNFFGAVDMIKAVLPGMRARRSGAIVNISSIGARICPPGSGYYSASKAALEGLSGSLHKELQPLGISVIVVEPGGFRTDFAGRSLTQSPTPIADYAETAGPRRKEHDTVHGTQPGDPDKAARAIITAADSPTPPRFLLLGQDAYGAITGVLDADRAEIERWKDLTTSTGFDAS